MSIPKEPRQLMINIMYLVLTALLALNVSAEVFNAFKVVDKGLIKSNSALDQSNAALPDAIRTGAKKKESLAKYAELIEPGRNLGAEMNQYIQQLKDDMIADKGYVVDKETGKETDELVGKKDFDVTTRILVDGPNQDGNGKGAELKQKLDAYKKAMLDLVEDDPDTEVNEKEEFNKAIALKLDDETWKKKGKPSWHHMNFSHMPLQAVLPLLTKYQNDVKSTEAAFLSYLAGKVGTTTDVVIDKYTVVSAAENSYIIKGDPYKAEVFLSAAASADSKTGITVSVDGRSLPTNSEGIATYTTTPSSVGKKSYTATATITNPTTGETQSFKKTFNYEVGERGVSVSATKMNVFYIGVPNPVSVTAAGVPSNQIKVSMSGAGGGKIVPKNGNYEVTATKPTKSGEFAYVNVSGPGLNEKREFRVKRIPDPVAKLGGKAGGLMDPGTFRVQLGIGAFLDGFDFDAKCSIKGYRMLYVPKREDAIPVLNVGARFGADAKKYIGQAKPGDTFNFIDVKAQCPGDIAAREINSLVFSIK